MSAAVENLALANPFFDRTTYVSQEFLREQNLKIGEGECTDDLSRVENSWKAAMNPDMPEPQKLLGGSGTNILKVLARLGHSCAVVGRKGAGESGEQIEALLKERGIIPYLKESSKDTGLVNCFISEEGERTMQTYVGSAQEFSKNDIEKDTFEGVRHVHLEGYSAYSPGSLERGIKYSAESGAFTSLNLARASVVDDCKPEFLSILDRVDIVFGNTLEFNTLKAHKHVDELIELFPMKQIVVITDGAKGCWIKEQGKKEFIHYSATLVQNVIDTTGAGDFFAGGFLHGLLEGKSTWHCVEMGNLAASRVIQHIGADLPEKDWEDLKLVVKNLSQEELEESELAVHNG